MRRLVIIHIRHLLLSAVLLTLCAALLPNTLHAQEQEKIDVLSVRAKLYLRIGDYYASRQENEKAATAYRQAAQLAQQRLPAQEQLEIIRRLANVNDLDAAILNSRRLCNEQTTDLNACLELARYLSWSNQPLGASEVGARILQLAPDNTDALLIQANALSWQGDAAGALEHYETLLRDDASLDLALAYSQALLASGNLAAAKISRSYLRAESPLEQAALDDLDQTLQREAQPRLHLGSEHYSDAYDGRYTRNTLGLDLARATAWLYLRLGRSDSSDPWQAIELEQFHLGGKARINDRTQLGVLAGSSAYADGAHASVATGNMELQMLMQKTRLQLSLSRELYDESVLALDNRIVRLESEINVQHQLTDRWEFALGLNGTDYSDDNRSTETMLSASYAFHLGPPRMSLGLKSEAVAFARQSGGGYFAPDEMISNKLLFAINKYTEQLSAGVELFSGSQSISIFGYTQNERIAGGLATLRYQPLDAALIELSWEGGHFALGRAYAYRYNLSGIKAYLFF